MGILSSKTRSFGLLVLPVSHENTEEMARTLIQSINLKKTKIAIKGRKNVDRHRYRTFGLFFFL